MTAVVVRFGHNVVHYDRLIQENILGYMEDADNVQNDVILWVNPVIRYIYTKRGTNI
jgi:hypothetical protein